MPGSVRSARLRACLMATGLGLAGMATVAAGGGGRVGDRMTETTDTTDADAPANPESPGAERLEVHVHRSRIDVPVAAVTSITAIASSLMYWAIHYNLTDDGYITLAYAKTLAFHGEWGMVPHHPANAATSPFNVLLIALGTFVTRRPLLALGFVFVGSFTVLAWSLAHSARTLRLPVLSALVAVALLLFNPIFLSSTGLESALYAALLGVLLMSAVDGRRVIFAVVAGFALLTRLDMVLFVVPLILWTPRLRERVWHTIGIAVGVSAPFFVLRWILAGSAIPDTFVIKTLQRAFGDISFGNGPFRYIDSSGDLARWSFAPVLFAAIATMVWLVAASGFGRHVDARLMPVVALAIGAIAYYAAYTALNVPAYHWYYSPVIAASCMVLGLLTGALSRLLRRTQWFREGRWRPAALLVFALPLWLLYREARVVQQHGLPWKKTPVFFGNWAEPEYYRIAARQVRFFLADGRTATGPGEIGVLAFYCECGILDAFSDERYARPLIQQRIDDAAPTLRLLLEANYHNVDLHAPIPPVDFHLVYEPGWVQPGPYVWNLWSSPHGPGHLQLIPA